MVRVAVILAMLVAGGSARAGTLQTIDGTTYNGVVETVTETGVKFLWQKDKDQPEDIRRQHGDNLYEAQGQKAEMRDIPFTSIAKIEDVPVDRFPALFQYNLFFRTIQEVQAGWIRATASGDFVRQAKSMAVLLAALLLLVPLLLTLVSAALPGERLSFFEGILFAFGYTVVGMGAALGSTMLSASVPAMASGGAQAGLTVVIVLLLSLATHLGTRHSFWQGLAFTVVWGGSLFLAGRLAARLAGVGGGF